MLSTSLPFSMFYLSLLALLAIVLSYGVVKIRQSTKIGIGDGDNKDLFKQMRIQANMLENLLPFSILYVLAELNGHSTLYMHIVGSVFLISRILHAYGMTKTAGVSFGRYYGTLGTWLSILTLVGTNFYQSIMILFVN